MNTDSLEILQGRKGLLIGATGGLGHALARELTAAGAALFVHGRSNKSALAELETFVAASATADLRSYEEVVRLFGSVGEWCAGQLDFLVYAAGINPTAETLADTSIEDWDETFAVNVTGAFYALKAGLPLLRQAPNPKVVIISSIFGVESPANRGAYGASKHALAGLVQTLAREEGERIHVNALCPGPAWGDNVRHIFQEHAKERGITVEEYVKQRVSRIPAGRFLEPEELGRVVATYCSPLTDYVNGQIIRVTGGASE